MGPEEFRSPSSSSSSSESTKKHRIRQGSSEKHRIRPGTSFASPGAFARAFKQKLSKNSASLQTCGLDELFLSYLLQLEDLLQCLRDLWSTDAHLLARPRLEANTFILRSMSYMFHLLVLNQATLVCRENGSFTSLISSPGGGGILCF